MDQHRADQISGEFERAVKDLGIELASAAERGAYLATGARSPAGRYMCVLVTHDIADRLEQWLKKETEMLEAAAKHAGIKAHSRQEWSQS